jgi:hypothetical protein
VPPARFKSNAAKRDILIVKRFKKISGAAFAPDIFGNPWSMCIAARHRSLIALFIPRKNVRGGRASHAAPTRSTLVTNR